MPAVLHIPYPEIGNPSTEPCLCCGSTTDVKLEDSRTHYETPRRDRYEKFLAMGEDNCPADPVDPNAPIPLCRACAKEHHSEWDERWAEYHSGLM